MSNEKEQAKRSAKLIAGLAAFAIAATCLAPSGIPAAPSEAHAYTQVEKIVSSGHGHIDPQFLCVHETANPGATEWNHVSLWSRGWPYACHYIAGLNGQTVVHTMADDRKSWSVGNGNSRVVSIELCHATNKEDFDRQWTEAVKWCGDYLHKRGWGIDRLISHNDARQRWGGTDHTDPESYFSAYGRSFSQFKSEVSSYMATGNVGGTIQDGSTTSQSAQPSATTSSGTTYTTTASALCVRKGPGTGYGKVTYGGLTANAKSHAFSNGCLKQGTRVTVLETSGNWARIPSGWICADYLAKAGSKQSSTSATASTDTYRTTASALCVRKGPGTGYARISYGSLTANAKSHAFSNGCLKKGTRVTVLETRGNWSRIPSGWVCSDYLKRA